MSSEIAAHLAVTEAGDSNELAEELQLALQKLREDYRTCFVLFYQQELSCAEIGEILKRPKGTVKTWLHRARQELVEFLERRGISDSRVPLEELKAD